MAVAKGPHSSSSPVPGAPMGVLDSEILDEADGVRVLPKEGSKTGLIVDRCIYKVETIRDLSF